MPEFADIYGLSVTRTSNEIYRFLEHFLPSAVESADEYEIPQYSDCPHTVLQTADELIAHCCENSNEVHALYWRSDSIQRHAEVFFLEDQNLIFGISTPSEDPSAVDAVARDLCSFLNSSDVFVTYEDVPPENTNEFRVVLENLNDEPTEGERRSRAHKPILVEQAVPPKSDRAGG